MSIGKQDIRRGVMRRTITGIGRFLITAVSATTMVATAHATDFVETTDFSNNGATPTLLGVLTPGSNFITGAITSYGAVVGTHGELSHEDQDFVTFTVPAGYALTNFIVSNGTTIGTSPRPDLLFLGLASGNSVNYDPTFSTAAGLLGWTLVSQSQLGTDILPAIGAATYPNFAVPGAPGFTGSLGAGTYSLWIFDGDAGATYSFNAQVAPVPEAATWMMMIAGVGLMGAAFRARRARPVARRSARV